MLTPRTRLFKVDICWTKQAVQTITAWVIPFLKYSTHEPVSCTMHQWDTKFYFLLWNFKELYKPNFFKWTLIIYAFLTPDIKDLFFSIWVSFWILSFKLFLHLLNPESTKKYFNDYNLFMTSVEKDFFPISANFKNPCLCIGFCTRVCFFPPYLCLLSVSIYLLLI